MPITSLDQLVAAFPGQHRHLYKGSVTTKGAGLFHSLWTVPGLPGAGVSPPVYTAGAGYTPDKNTLGAVPFVNPSAGLLSYLARASLNSSLVGLPILYDRLWACSGLSGTPTTAQAITTPGALSRNTDGTDVELWGECYGTTGTTASTWTASYTNSSGVAGRTATYVKSTATEIAGQMFPFTLQSGDTGVSSVQSFTCSITNATPGNVGLTLLRRLVEFPVLAANTGLALDPFALGMPQIPDDACLALMLLCSSATSGVVTGSVDLVQG